MVSKLEFLPGGTSHVSVRDRPQGSRRFLAGGTALSLLPPPQPLPAPEPPVPPAAREGRSGGPGLCPLPAAQHGGSGGGSPGPGAQPRRLSPHPGAEALPRARLSPGDPQSPSLSPCPPGAPRKPGGPEGAGARLASSFIPRGAGTAGRRQRRAGGRYGHSPRPRSRREPRPPPSFGRCPGKQRARAKECGRRGGTEQCVPGTAQPGAPRPALRSAPGRSCGHAHLLLLCCSSCPAPPWRCGARRWLSLPGLPAAPSPPCCPVCPLPWRWPRVGTAKPSALGPA
ncbi:basic proline-rich protein-like [Cinclus cinclus]|uniref:basic proline-rich protein-like n=1 Tax=Cinclus cinclus TaxID=127875 RepID=UPI002E11D1D1